MILTIVTVVFNDHEGLKKTYESLSKQSDTEFEWVVIDGNSTDDTVKFMNGINTKFNTVCLSEPDKGIYDAMNKGINLSSGCHVLFLNAGDDLATTKVVANIKPVLEMNYDSVVMGGFIMVCGKRHLIRKTRNIEYICHSLPTSHQAIFYPKSFLKNQKYNLDFKVSSDYYITCSAYMTGIKFVTTNFIISKFYTGGFSTLNRHLVLKDMYKVQRDVLEIGLIKRVFSFVKRGVNMKLVDLISKF